MMDGLFMGVALIQVSFLVFCLVAICYLVVRRLNIKEKEDFEKRDN